VYFHISVATSAVGGAYVPFIPRNDGVRVCVRDRGAASASGNSGREALRGSFIRRLNGVGECGSGGERRRVTLTRKWRHADAFEGHHPGN